MVRKVQQVLSTEQLMHVLQEGGGWGWGVEVGVRGGGWGWGLRRQERQCDTQEVILVQFSQMQTLNKSSQPMY